MAEGRPADLRTRLARAIHSLSVQLANAPHARGGALIQVWMPNQLPDGTVVLSAQGLPFAVAGVGDLLALFRCVSCRYRFSTDVNKPTLMGAIGRVFVSCEPEMCNDVQKYDKQVYLRVSEAQRCRVHSTLVMPVFDGAGGMMDDDDGCARRGQRAVAVFEVVQSERDVMFPEMMGWLRACLEEVDLTTSDLESLQLSLGSDPWPAGADAAAAGPSDAAAVAAPSAPSGGGAPPPPVASPPQRLVPEGAAAAALAAAVSGAQAARRRMLSRQSEDSGSRAGSDGAALAAPRSSLRGAKQEVSSSGGGTGSGGVDSGSGGTTDAGVKQEQARVAAGQTACAGGKQPSAGGAGGHVEEVTPQLVAAMASVEEMLRLLPVAGKDLERQQRVLGAIAASAVINPVALQALQRWHELQAAGGAGGSGGGLPKDGSAGGVSVRPGSSGGEAGSGEVAMGEPSMQQQPQQQQRSSSKLGLPPSGAGPRVGAACAAVAAPDEPALVAAAARSEAVPAVTKVEQEEEEEDAEGGDAKEDADEDDELADGDGSSNSDNEGTGKAGGGRGRSRLTGAGRKLAFEDLQAQFGLGLKEAAANLGICATTLKRACRRNGITRWPRRQIAKLNRALAQAGYQGMPPQGLVQRAVNSTGLTQQQMASSLATKAAAKAAGASAAASSAGAAAAAPAAGGHTASCGGAGAAASVPVSIPIPVAAAAGAGAAAITPAAHSPFVSGTPPGVPGLLHVPYAAGGAPGGAAAMLAAQHSAGGMVGGAASFPPLTMPAADGGHGFVFSPAGVHPGAAASGQVLVTGPGSAGSFPGSLAAAVAADGGVLMQQQLQQQHAFTLAPMMPGQQMVLMGGGPHQVPSFMVQQMHQQAPQLQQHIFVHHQQPAVHPQQQQQGEGQQQQQQQQQAAQQQVLMQLNRAVNNGSNAGSSGPNAVNMSISGVNVLNMSAGFAFNSNSGSAIGGLLQDSAGLFDFLGDDEDMIIASGGVDAIIGDIAAAATRNRQQ